jgi:hypothetical protein
MNIAERRPVRVAATVVALLALLGLGLRPRWPATSPAGVAVLRTPGADAPTARRLADSLGHVPVLPNARAVRRDPSLRVVHIVGWGLDAEEWRALGSAATVVFHPAPPPALPGFRRASWPATLALGEELVVEGEVGNAPAGATIALLDPGGVVDSAPVGSGGFQLAARPRATGPLLCVLRLSVYDRPVAQETIGVTVTRPPAPRLLIVESSPRFESRALRDWLAARRGVLAIRSTVSRGRYRSEFVNRDPVPLTTLTTDLLSEFDVVAIDGRSLGGLTAGERAALRRAVTTAGLGVLIVPDSAVYDATVRYDSREFFLGFRFSPTAGGEERAVRPQWPGSRRRTVTAVAAEPYTLSPQFGTEPLIDDGMGGLLAQVTPRGAGRVGVSLVRDADRWIRAGERDAFSGYWSRLLSAVAGRDREDHWEIESPGPWLVDHPIALAVVTAAELPVAVVSSPAGARDTVFLARDPFSPSRWRGVFWPREPGWHRIESPSGPSFYAQTGDAWHGRRGSALLDASRRYLVTTAGGAGQPARQSRPVSRPIAPAWFFGAFVLCVAVLWSRRRLA